MAKLNRRGSRQIAVDIIHISSEGNSLGNIVGAKVRETAPPARSALREGIPLHG